MRTAQAYPYPRKRHVATARTTSRQQNVAPRPRRKAVRKSAHAPLPNGLSVMGLVVVILAVIGGMLVISLNWQRNAHSLAQEEVSLRSALDTIGDERQQLLIDERRASNPRVTAARALDAGLNEIKLDEGVATAKSAAKTTKPVAGHLAATKALPAAAKTIKPAAPANTTKPLSSPVAAKASQPSGPKADRAKIPTMPHSITKPASVKATLSR